MDKRQPCLSQTSTFPSRGKAGGGRSSTHTPDPAQGQCSTAVAGNGGLPSDHSVFPGQPAFASKHFQGDQGAPVLLTADGFLNLPGKDHHVMFPEPCQHLEMEVEYDENKLASDLFIRPRYWLVTSVVLTGPACRNCWGGTENNHFYWWKTRWDIRSDSAHDITWKPA